MEVELCTPAEVKELLSNMDIIKRFPMICYEKDESNIEGKTPEEIMDNAKTMEYNGEWMVFTSMNVIIGLVCATVEDKTTRNLYLYDFEVAIDAQGNGFSNTMLDYVYKYARNHSCEYVTLMAFDDNARSYWEHQGFTLSPRSTEQMKLLFKKL